MKEKKTNLWNAAIPGRYVRVMSSFISNKSNLGYPEEAIHHMYQVRSVKRVLQIQSESGSVKITIIMNKICSYML